MKKIIFVAALIVIAVIMFSKRQNTSSGAPSEIEDTPTALEVKKEELKVNSEALSSTTTLPPTNKIEFTTVETNEEKLRKQGYVDDPKDPNRMMKTFIDESGKKKIFYRFKFEDSFEIPDKTVKGAWETLESKGNINPAEEIQKLSRIEHNDTQAAMLSGYFRDDENDIEAYFGAVTDENGNSQEVERVCFVAPKLGLNFKPSMGKHIIRVDDTGYGVVKLTEAQYLRITWSFENKRIVHGEVVVFERGTYRSIKRFNAKGISVSTGEKLKYCK